jgi:hypothetical protein
VSVVGPLEEVMDVAGELGRVAAHPIEFDHRAVDVRRVVVSSRRVAGVAIDSLGLDERFGATITRIRRGDVDLVAEPEMQLELGDRVRVVCARERMPDVSRFLGDSYRALGEIDVLSFGFGIAAGLALGAIALPLPGGGSFELGSAGGPLVVGLALGAIGRTGPMVWQLPYTASLTLRQFGTVIFLAGIGLRAGGTFGGAVKRVLVDDRPSRGVDRVGSRFVRASSRAPTSPSVRPLSFTWIVRCACASPEPAGLPEPEPRVANRERRSASLPESPSRAQDRCSCGPFTFLASIARRPGATRHLHEKRPAGAAADRSCGQ